MKLILFLSILGAFILDTVSSSSGGGVIGLTVTNAAIFVAGFVLMITDVSTGRLAVKNLTGVGFAIIISVAVILSLYYAQRNGVYGGSFLENIRKAKSFVLEPAVLYVLAFLLIDTREQGERYLLYLVTVLGVLNLASAIGTHFGIELYQVAESYDVEDDSGRRLAGFTGNPNKTAYLACVLIPFQYYFYKFHESRLIRILMAIIMAGGIAVVMLTGSRGGLLVLMVVILVLAYRLRDMRVVYGSVLVIPVLVGVLLITDSTLLYNAFERMGTLTSSDAREFTSGRNLIWSALLSDYTDSIIGMLFGNGFGAAKFMGIRNEAHNVYLRVLVEFGIIGIGFFLYSILSMFRYVKRIRLDKDDALRASVLASGYVVVFAWFFTTLIGVLNFIWFTIGVSMAALLSSSKDARRKKRCRPGALIGNQQPTKS